MCGIIGIVGKNPVNQLLYDGLLVLQHRGQDAAGIVTCDGNTFFMHKSNGLVKDVFQTRHMRSLIGNAGIAHVRYPTAGSSSAAEAQPFYVNSPFGIVLGHNGNLTNSEQLKSEMFKQDLRHINTTSDSEVLLNVLAHEIERTSKSAVLNNDMAFDAVAAVHRRCKGAYAVVAMIADFGLLAFRDPHGIRPLVIGKMETEKGTEYIVASESVALDVLGFTLMRDVEPGEAIFIDMEGNLFSQQCAENPQLTPCIFEYVYLARPDSLIDGVSVYQTRLDMGASLAEKIKREWGHLDIDVVIPIPDTSRPSALQVGIALGLEYREGFIKNRYIGRTFIMPGQALRKKSVRQKLNPIGVEFKGKNVLLIDDSIVRGTTSKQIVQMARDAGARKVYFASAAPPVRFPNVYGIDMPSRDELLATDRTDQEICDEIGADGLIYQDLQALEANVLALNPNIQDFDSSCFDGHYVTGDVDTSYLERIESLRKDATQTTRPPNSTTQMDLNLVAMEEDEFVAQAT
ncbi:MAG: amidophosphoribosyltransferase [Methylophilaceae bacterium]|nr:amidophosphoribosyltransferase [Methylophilaceae bacterium]MDG1445972.1 amidophosphoribosyltransferase [Methylophilaceae bacterium]MDG1821743.1 amidophosphoribosyltransferase [Methylophilaceae bacterium]MDG2293787.1 amidophosphoribosyltransferase [Methylophilaceae bacterium]